MEDQKNAIIDIGKNLASMPEVERKIADYILRNPEKVIYMAVHQLSAQTGVSDGSIIRFSNRLGYSGFTQMKINIAQNLSNKEEVIYDRLSSDDTPREAMLKTVENTIAALKETAKFVTNGDMMRAADLLLAMEGKLEFYGVGSSAMVAMDAYYRFMRLGYKSYAVTDAHICCVSASMLNEQCVAVGISHSGSTRETMRAMEIAKEKGAGTICLTSFARSPLAKLCDVSLVTVSNESERNKEAVASRIAQLVLLDALCGYLAVKRSDQSIGYIENLVDIIGEHRI